MDGFDNKVRKAGKTMRQRNVILIGFMGSGKTTIGLKLSYKLQMPVEDTDKLIERREGRSISTIFAEDGEAYFREQETKLLEEIKERSYARIISVGGGTPVREENRRLLKECGTVIYLRIRPETVYKRLRNDTKRPLLQCEDPLSRIKELLEARKDAYESCADIIVDVDDCHVEQILGELTEKLYKITGQESKVYVRAERECQQEKVHYKDEHRDEIVQDVKVQEQTESETQKMKLLVINGPNLNFLGIREKSVYGNQDYQYLLDLIAKKGEETGTDITVFQSNYEGGIIDRIQEAYFDGTEGIVINPGAYTHYSYAIRDALASITVPKVEIHISDITKREEFRKVSVTAPVCDKQIYGQGLDGYLQAIDFILEKK